LTEIESLNGRKIICMSVFHRELEFKRQETYIYVCI
jgi:hypothetical protein